MIRHVTRHGSCDQDKWAHWPVSPPGTVVDKRPLNAAQLQPKCGIVVLLYIVIIVIFVIFVTVPLPRLRLRISCNMLHVTCNV